jgi:Holliday junction resolvasome RuvABC DNA-binding subunit
VADKFISDAVIAKMTKNMSFWQVGKKNAGKLIQELWGEFFNLTRNAMKRRSSESHDERHG